MRKIKFVLLTLFSISLSTGCTNIFDTPSVNNTNNSNNTIITNSSSEAIKEEADEAFQIYKLAVESGYEGTYEEWLESIKGEKGEQGEKGDQGEKGEPGIDGKTVITGSSNPSNSIGNESDLYINTVTWDVFIKVNGEWNNLGNIKGEKGEQGATGEKGEQGETGATGATGATGEKGDSPYIGYNGNWWIGQEDTGVKAQGQDGENGENGANGQNGETPYIGNNGNWWIGQKDTGVKAEGSDGQDGKNGIDGLDGATWIAGEGAPSYSIGKDGDLYIDSLSWNVYLKTGGVWTSIGNIKGNDAAHYGETVTVTFDVNGGVMPYGYLDEVTIYYGESLNLPIPTKQNHEFMGWFTGFSTNDGQVTNATPITKNMNLVAIWNAGPESNRTLYHCRAFDKWEVAASGVINGVNTIVYQYGKIYNVPISHADAIIYNNVDITLTNKTISSYSTSIENTFKEVATLSSNVSSGWEIKTKASSGVKIQGILDASASAESKVNTSISLGMSASMEDTTSTMREYYTSTENTVTYTLGKENGCKSGYAYRETTTANFNLYLVAEYNKSTGAKTFSLENMCDGNYSKIIEESNSDGYFESDEISIESKAEFIYDSNLFNETGLYLVGQDVKINHSITNHRIIRFGEIIDKMSYHRDTFYTFEYNNCLINWVIKYELVNSTDYMEVLIGDDVYFTDDFAGMGPMSYSGSGNMTNFMEMDEEYYLVVNTNVEFEVVVSLTMQKK